MHVMRDCSHLNELANREYIILRYVCGVCHHHAVGREATKTASIT